MHRKEMKNKKKNTQQLSYSSHYKKRDRRHERTKDKSTNEKKQTNKLQDNIHPLSPLPHLVINQLPHLLIPFTQTINQKKAKNPEMRFNSQQIISYCLGLHTQNPGLREVDLEPSPKRGSDKINMLK